MQDDNKILQDKNRISQDDNKISQDDSGAVLESLVNSDAVLTAFAKQVSSGVKKVQHTRDTIQRKTSQDDLPTGHCIALVEGAERTLAANLGAANKFSAEDLWQGNNRTMLEGAKVKNSFLRQFFWITFYFKVIYVEGYFLSHSPEATVELAR